MVSGLAVWRFVLTAVCFISRFCWRSVDFAAPALCIDRWRTLGIVDCDVATGVLCRQSTYSEAESIMSIEGTIRSVMESWPLQLVVDTETGRWQVALRDDTAITRYGEPADAHQIAPGVRVRVEGDVSGANALSVVALELL
jgi:hypothetical protein